jgi:hypothetical protein
MPRARHKKRFVVPRPCPPPEPQPAARRVRLLRAFVTVSALATANCTLALRRQHDQCSTSADCQTLAAGAVCTDEGVCARVLDTAPKPSPPARACKRDGECDGASLCDGGTCVSLADSSNVLSVDDPWDDRDRLAIGVLTELQDPPLPMVSAVAAAVTEINAATVRLPEVLDAGMLLARPPRLIAVACDEANPAAIVNLVNNGARILIGPSQAGSLLRAINAVNDNAVLFAPYNDAPDSAHLTSPLVSCGPSRSDSVRALLSAIGFIQSQAALTTATVLPLTADEEALDFGHLFTPQQLGTLATVLDYDPTERGMDLLSALQGRSLSPSLIVAPSADSDWLANISTVDVARAAGNLPYFLLADSRSAAFAGNELRTMSKQYARVVALGYQLSDEAQKAHDDVARDFHEETGGELGPGQDYAHDCTYLAAYAAIAAQLRFSLRPKDLTPGAIIRGLGALTGRGAVLSVSKADVTSVISVLNARLGADDSVDLVGSSGDLDLPTASLSDADTLATRSVYVHPNAGPEELYCIDTATGEFCDTGVTFPATGGDPVRAKSNCSCAFSQ